MKKQGAKDMTPTEASNKLAEMIAVARLGVLTVPCGVLYPIDRLAQAIDSAIEAKTKPLKERIKVLENAVLPLQEAAIDQGNQEIKRLEKGPAMTKLSIERQRKLCAEFMDIIIYYEPDGKSSEYHPDTDVLLAVVLLEAVKKEHGVVIHCACDLV